MALPNHFGREVQADLSTFVPTPSGRADLAVLTFSRSPGGVSGRAGSGGGATGAGRVVGMPMDEQRHFTRGQAWDMATFHRDGWTKALPKIERKVRSMSGWTRELLGGVTLEWLEA